MKTIHLRIFGIVQGVGYRQWFRNEMKRLKMTGWVKNRDDGSVEAVVSGSENAIEVLVARARIGPPLAAVTDVHSEVLQ